jgi:hypothetical protein
VGGVFVELDFEVLGVVRCMDFGIHKQCQSMQIYLEAYVEYGIPL